MLIHLPSINRDHVGKFKKREDLRSRRGHSLKALPIVSSEVFYKRMDVWVGEPMVKYADCVTPVQKNVV